jgi:hypothetical protein
VTPDVEDVPTDTPTDTPTDSTGCPPDDATHIYINLSGHALPVGTADVAGMYLAAYAPTDILFSTGAPPLGTTTAQADGTYSFECLDVGSVTLGLIVLSDDAAADGTAGTFFPTMTGVASWDVDGKVDLEGKFAFGLPNAVVGVLATLTGITPYDDGMTMGIILDEARAPIAGGTVERDGAGTPVSVAYPMADMSGLMTPPATSASGIWVLDEPLAGMTNLTANATGHAYPTYPAATLPGYCFFLPFPAETP